MLWSTNIEDGMIVLSKEGKYEYIQHGLVYLLRIANYDDALFLEQEIC